MNFVSYPAYVNLYHTCLKFEADIKIMKRGATTELVVSACCDVFRLCPQYVNPPPPQLQSTCHYIVHHYAKIWHVGHGGCK